MLSWIRDTFTPQILSSAQDRIDAKTEAAYQAALNAPSAEDLELRVKRGDVLTLETGSGITTFAGDISAQISGALVDVTEGAQCPGQLVLAPDHRYLAAEKTKAVFTVNSDTAVVRLNGVYQLAPSNAVDYNKLANALSSMGLFKGSDSGYGSGYDLEKAPTRIQGLIMFLRLMGEEHSALQYVGNVTFSDVPDWALPYVAYAYDKGYTNGMGYDEQWRVIFGTDLPLKAQDYVTFLLRALGYSEGVDFKWETALDDGLRLRVLTKGETTLLKSSAPFLRAQVAYLSYFALQADYPGQNMTLQDRLVTMGAITDIVDAGVPRL